jgi:hypothetical protein
MGGHQIIAFRRNFNTTENKSEQALQIIGHVVAEFYANKCSMHGHKQFVDSNATLSDIGKIYKINKSNT